MDVLSDMIQRSGIFLLSQKQLLLLKKVYRQITQQYYQDQSSQYNAKIIISMNNLLMQSIDKKQQTNKLSNILSILEILKIKCKSNVILYENVMRTIGHLKQPRYNKINYNTIVDGFQNMSLFSLTCTFTVLFYSKLLKCCQTIDWKPIISQIGRYPSLHTQTSLQLLNLICKDNDNLCRVIVKSGFIKFIISCYLQQKLHSNDKFLLYRGLKFIKLISSAQRGILKQRQYTLANIIYKYDDYIIVLQQLCNKCYIEEYCNRMYEKIKYDNVNELDCTYVWSYNENFIRGIKDKNVKEMLKVVYGGNVNEEIEMKIYAVLNNIVKYKKQNIQGIMEKMPKTRGALFNYLKLVISSVENDEQCYKNIKFSLLEKLVADDPNVKSQKMFKYLQSLQSKQKKANHLNSQLVEMFSVQKNAYMLMQKAGKVPQNNEDLRYLKQILNQKQVPNNQFQNDIMHSVKKRALQSISSSVILKNPIDLNSIVKDVQLSSTLSITKLLKIIEVGIMMQHFTQQNFDKKRILHMIQTIQNNYQGQLIDWGSISQILLIFQGENAWEQKVNQLGKNRFWLLTGVEYDQEQYEKLIRIIEKIFSQQLNNNSYKNSLIIGFLGKSLSREQKIKFMSKFPQLFKKIQYDIKNQTNNNWKINLYMLSLFLFDWHDQNNDKSNKIFQSLISPIHDHIITHFKSTQHQYKFLQSCLPYKISPSKLIQNIDYLLSQYGKLASYIYSQSYPKPAINYDKISNLTHRLTTTSYLVKNQNQKQNILQIIMFLKTNPLLLHGEQFMKIWGYLINLQDKKVYWELYPNYVTLVKAMLQIGSKSDNFIIINAITDILEKIIEFLQNNDQITPEEKSQIYEEIIKMLLQLKERNVYIDVERVKRVVKHNINQEYQDKKDQMLKILGNYKVQKKIEQKQVRNLIQEQEKQFTQENVYKPSEVAQMKSKQKQQQNQQLSSLINNNYMTKNIANSSKTQPIQYQSTTKSIACQQQQKQQMNSISSLQQSQVQHQRQHLAFSQKQQKNIQSQLIKLQQKPQSQSQSQSLCLPSSSLNILQALRLIKRIIDHKSSPTQFPRCLQTINNCSKIQNTHKDILGHLLVKYYCNIQKNKEIIGLLLNKEKTNLSKETCYQIISKNQEAFVLADRWKLLGREWMDIAVLRMGRKQFLAAGCQVIQYNLIKIDDLHYFYSKKYHIQILKHFPSIKQQQQSIYFLLLIGTSARFADIKRYYIKDKLHLSILPFIQKQKWQHNIRLTANLFYALSSLVYIQPEICLDIVKKDNAMGKLLRNFREFYQSRAVVESGGCFIANMAYSNDEVKEILRGMKIIQKMAFVFMKNLELPQISIFKQLLRGFGNLSLSQKCAHQIVDSGFSSLLISLIQKFNMFMNLDQNKMKLLKIAIDVLANLCSHKYHLEIMHKQHVTATIIMLLQTTQINPPIIMGCIDTVDGLCQNSQIQSFAVIQKKLPYILIDILKIQQDQKIIIKATRLLTNLTINVKNIEQILQANLLSVLANIVMPSFFMKYNKNTEINYLSNNPTASSAPNTKMEVYINKILVRIYNAKPNFQLLLKSGYLDCLVRTIQTADNLQDVYIVILDSYAKVLPNFLNKKAFMCLIRVLTFKIKSKQTIDNCLKIFKTLLLRSYDRDQQDIVIEDSPKMYEKMLQLNKIDTLFILGLHCSISVQLRKLLIAKEKENKIMQMLNQMVQNEELQDLASAVLFSLNKDDNKNTNKRPQITVSEEQAAKILKQGLICQLYRIDGSCKKGKIMMIQDQKIAAFKYPGGQIKNKYTCNLKTIRDWQFNYQKSSRQWKMSVFNKNKGMFSSQIPPQNCCTLVGGVKWGEVAYINVVLNSKEEKEKFKKALDTLIFARN